MKTEYGNFNNNVLCSISGIVLFGILFIIIFIIEYLKV